MAVYGIAVDFVAAEGTPDSDLARVLRDEFNLTLLPTQDPFSITVVRTVHGLTLDDLDCMRRYRAELTYLLPHERNLIKLVGDPEDLVYRVQNLSYPTTEERKERCPRSSAGESWQPAPSPTSSRQASARWTMPRSRRSARAAWKAPIRFGDEFDIPIRHDSYEALAADP